MLGSLVNVSGCFCRSKHFLCELPISDIYVFVGVFLGICACVGLLCLRVFVHESGRLLVCKGEDMISFNLSAGK